MVGGAITRASGRGGAGGGVRGGAPCPRPPPWVRASGLPGLWRRAEECPGACLNRPSPPAPRTPGASLCETPGSCVPGKAAVAAVGARPEGESREARNGGAGRLDHLESRSSPAASKSRVQAALREPLDARRTCHEAGTRGAGLGWGPGSPGRWGSGLGEVGWRAVLSLCGRWKWLRAFSRSANCKGTLPVVPS